MKLTLLNATFRSIASLVHGKLGRCSRCIRRSFITALAAWGVVLLVIQLSKSIYIPYLVATAAAVAAVCTLLWISHLLVSAKRYVDSLPKKTRSSTALEKSLSRRDVLPLFAKSVGVAALWSALPRMASADPCNQFDKSPTGHCVSNCESAYVSCIGSPGSTSYSCKKDKAACERACGC
jgi:hypothetical protein